MSFTTWPALRTAIKDAIADHVAGTPCTGAVTLSDGKTIKYRNYDELCGLIQKTYMLEALEQPVTPSTRVSYGRYRRLR